MPRSGFEAALRRRPTVEFRSRVGSVPCQTGQRLRYSFGLSEQGPGSTRRIRHCRNKRFHAEVSFHAGGSNIRPYLIENLFNFESKGPLEL